MAETKPEAEAAFDGFIESYAVKYRRPPNVSSRMRDALLAF